MNAADDIMPLEYTNSLQGQNLLYHRFDIVFHGAAIAPKGIFFLLKLAELMPDYSFLVPDSYSNVYRVTKLEAPNNVSFVQMSWESGLRQAVSSARLVINPSMWSAPIEGALVKSAKFNNNATSYHKSRHELLLFARQHRSENE